MTDTLFLLTALSAGFFGSPHCFGMCGGIVSALGFAVRTDQPSRRFFLQCLYHLGRLGSYTLLGCLTGWLGKGLLAPLAGSVWPYVLGSGMMLVFGLYLSGWWRGLDKLETLGGRLWQGMAPLRQRFMPVTTAPRALVAGMLWGFLPCGLVYSALALAMTSGSPGLSALAMLAFGIGTLPMMLMTGAAAATLKQKLNEQGWRKANGLLVMAFGVWTLVQALSHDGHAHHHHDAAPVPVTNGVDRTPDTPAAGQPTPSPATTPPISHDHHAM